jgi:hypothetical protein
VAERGSWPAARGGVRRDPSSRRRLTRSTRPPLPPSPRETLGLPSAPRCARRRLALLAVDARRSVEGRSGMVGFARVLPF